MSITKQEHQTRMGLAWGLIILGILSRLIPHPWNATPVMAIALFSGTYLSQRFAWLLPLAIVAFTDIFLGWHNTIPFTWGAFALTSLLGLWVRENAGTSRILLGCLSGSLLFFVITNFGVWMIGGLYSPSWRGLQECYIAAIPFFRNTLMGDLIYTGILFTVYGLANQPQLARVRVSR